MKHQNIGDLIVLASTIDMKPPKDPKGYLTNYLAAIQQCHDEVANVVLAYASSEG